MPKIVFSFAGGSLDNSVLSADTDNWSPDQQETTQLYFKTNNGEEGSRFAVPKRGGVDMYQVVMRLVRGNNVFVRASHVHDGPMKPESER